MPISEQSYDVVIIGAGAAGIAAAESAASRGAKVCLIEAEALGGECPNRACIPTKAMLRAAKLYHQAKHELAPFGIHTGAVTFNFKELMARKAEVVRLITGDGQRLHKILQREGVKIISGQAEFVDPHKIKIGRRQVRGKKIVIATGAIDFVPTIAGLDEVGYFDYRRVTAMKRLPAAVVIVGAGPVGCEFATFFALLGRQVHLIEQADQILAHEDPEIAAVVAERLQALGVKIKTRTKALACKKLGRKKQIIYQTHQRARQTILANELILAAGKRPNIDALNLAATGIKLNHRGQLKLNSRLQTNVPHIFAAGDVTSGLMFTHTAHRDGFIAGHNATARRRDQFLKINNRVVPRVIFTEPEVASVGLTPAEAARKFKIKIARLPLAVLGRAVTDGRRQGFLKIIINAETRQILGAHMVGEHAGEIIHEPALAMEAHLTIDRLAGTMHAFPTYAEVVAAAAAEV